MIVFILGPDYSTYMEIRLDPSTLPATVPIPVYESTIIGEAEHKDVIFKIHLGLDRDLVEKLRQYSLDVSDVTL